MQEITITSWCDEHARKGERVEGFPTQPITFGNAKPKRLDLCEVCEKERLEPLRELLLEYGQPVDPGKPHQPRPQDVAPNGLAKPWACVECSHRTSTRQSALKHLASRHDYDLVSASKAIPPHGLADNCPLCGYLADPGTGMAGHVRAAHSEAEFKTWRATHTYKGRQAADDEEGVTLND